MDKRELFALLKRAEDDLGAQDAITQAISTNPGLVIEAWDTIWHDGGFHLIGNRIWVWAFRQAGFREALGNNNSSEIDEIRPATLPDDAILLYRGCPHHRRFGMSWSPIYSIAQGYSTRNAGGQRHSGNVYAHWAYPCELLAHVYKTDKSADGWPYLKGVWEEYIIDPEYLNDEVVRPIAVAPSNYAAIYATYAKANTPTSFALLEYPLRIPDYYY